ncbi:MAG: hypothetical protein Q7R35_07435 [Elusimicrobiota bacterium]|nr:hypothetical protein [Elusimicrobiota bacterium]
MNKNIEKTQVPTGPKIEYLGVWGMFIVWGKVIAITAVIVLILKYVFRIPFTF